MSRRSLVFLLVFAGMLVPGGQVAAHPHVADPAHHGAGQTIANGQLHGAFDGTESCGGDPAAYGLESAHHGPDSGIRGRADGCYEADAAPPSLDDPNPALG